MATKGKIITCQAAVLHDAKSPYKVETINVLPPTPGHVRIKLVATGLCHSDLGYADGCFPNQKYPCVAGHEGAGIVESVGEGVKSVERGYKVLTVFFPHCGECLFCQTKKTNLCLDIKRKIKPAGPFLRAEGMDGLTSFKFPDGKEIYHSFGCSSFSEYTVIPENSCVKINPATNLKSGCIMACGFLSGYGASANVSNVKSGDTVAVWGLGAVGLACIIGCKEKGATRIIGINVSGDREENAKKFGCTDYISLSKLEKGTNIIQKIFQMTANGVDYAFVCAGAVEAIEDAIECVRVGGTIVMAGLLKADEKVTFVGNSLLAGRKIIGTVYGDYFLFDDVPKVVDLYVEGKLPIDDFITNRFKLDQINDAVGMLKKRQGLSIQFLNKYYLDKFNLFFKIFFTESGLLLSFEGDIISTAVNLYISVCEFADVEITPVRWPSSSSSKLKVENLGEVLKKRVLDLKNVPDEQLDLVFLVDASDSVGDENFNSEIKFVYKLLAGYTVSFNKTRVALVTFSSKNHVITHIDHLTNASIKNNKCKMLANDMTNITYTGGGTFTLGALLETKKIMANGRVNSSKAVFLITDGYSNGGDPRPVAEQLKRDDVQVYTFGIRNGNVAELMDMSSEPKSEHCYILDSFEEFEALARRALHQDLHVGDHEVQERFLCDGLCKQPLNESGCCDAIATCTCGTHIGHHVCRCPVGHYGSGFHDDCLLAIIRQHIWPVYQPMSVENFNGKIYFSACPTGTYGDEEGLADVSGCKQCPENRNISKLGSSSIDDCLCRHGYQPINNSCVEIMCEKLMPPENGYFIKNNCSNVYNYACGIRCKPGYKAVGSSIRICGENGEWSGQPTICQIKHCPPLKIPKNGAMACDSQDFEFQTRCNFSCESGYNLIGSKTRSCLAIASWDGIAVHCRSITCSLLSPPENGVISPSKCTKFKSQQDDTCIYSCNEGFNLVGARKKECNEKGKWIPSNKRTQCVDITPPTITCPSNVVIETDLGESYATVVWKKPIISDNSGNEPTVVSIPVTTDNVHQFSIGISEITFVAEDKANNKANCSFIVQVIDVQPPTIDQYNSGEDVTISSTHAQNSTFPFGETIVTYVATDIYGNNNTCDITIIVEKDTCAFPFDPINGHANCSDSTDQTVCSLTCNEGYAFAFEVPDSFICSYSDSWTPPAKLDIQDCSVTSLPKEATENVVFTLEAENVPCDDAFFIHQVENKFQQRLDVKLDFYCIEDSICDVSYISANCEEFIAEDETENTHVVRKKRSWRRHKKTPQLVAIRFQLNVNSTPDSGVKKLKDSSKLFEAISSVVNRMRKDAEKGELDLRMGSVYLRYKKIRSTGDGPKYLCPAGSVLRKKLCVKCPVGTFYNVVTEKCQGCSRGTYQFLEGQLSCLVCPRNTSTSHGQLAKSSADCKAQCLPGTISSNGLEPCQTCKRGFYNPGYAKNDCIKCPGEMATRKRGTRSITQCKEKCGENFVSQSGLQPCYPCPTGYYQPSNGSTLCYKCFDLKANCTEDTINKTMELPINDCFSVPCLNGGSCRLISFGYVCDCPLGYTGMNCETNINECDDKPCRNNGKCIDGIGNYKCICQPGFQGINCEEDIDDCICNPCLNGGKCVDGVNVFSCDCPIGYKGIVCETNVDECWESPCLNGGTCVQDVGTRRCICLDSYAGNECQLKLNYCDDKPCLNGGTCYEDGVGKFKCQCPDGFIGLECQTDVDDCESQPCLNGGTCEDKINSYWCFCLTGFVGHQCQIKLANNFVMFFQSSSIFNYAQVDGFQLSLSELSFCLWLKTEDKLNYGTPISYATKESDNCLTLTDANGFVLYINGEKVITDVTANDGQWHFICVTWSANNGSWVVYKDSAVGDTGVGLSINKQIPNGGGLVIGQEQDQLNGGFSQVEAFVGHLGFVNFWDHVISRDDIIKLMTTCEEYLGNLKRCYALDTMVNGNVNVNGSQAIYNCSVGYNLFGDESRLCMIHGNWTGKKPECKKISCGFPGYLENGQIDNNGFDLRSVIHYKCKDGYQLHGNATRICQESGQWSGSRPECREIYCPTLTVPDNGFVNYSTENTTVGSVAEFSCRDGYRLDGSSVIYCSDDGSWDEESPLCQPVFCKNPPKITNGFITNTSINEVLVGQHITFDCDIGYQIQPHTFAPKIICSDRQEWDGEIPLCVTVDCGKPPIFPKALSIVIETTYNSSVTYFCQDGYKSAQWELICEANGHWTGQNLTCDLVECPMLQSITNGDFLVSSLKINGTVTYTCMAGYVLTGTATRICQSNSSWSGFPPTCTPITCPSPILIQNGGYDHSNGPLIPGVVISYSCNVGYNRVGPPQITCLHTGNWSQESPVCEIIECSIPNIVANAVYFGVNFQYNSNITYLCEAGFIIVGNPNSTCTKNRTWSGKPPFCQKVSCGPVENIKNGIVYFESFDYQSEVRYTCNSGFKLEGSPLRHCLMNGSWSSEEPTCILNRCVSPETIENGVVSVTESLVQYSCNDGYILSGASQRFCVTTDVPYWTGESPTCVKVTCTQPEISHNVIAYVYSLNYGTVVQLQCMPGYKSQNTVSSTNITCREDGSWSGNGITCIPQMCLPLGKILNGKTVGTSTNVNAVVQFECESGYKLVGESNITCTINETWSGVVPQCIAQTCPWPLNRLVNGLISITGYFVNDEVNYGCHIGYRLIGLQTRVCLSNGMWTGDDPVCSPVDCGQPDALPGTIVQVTSTLFENVANYSCLNDGDLIGDNQRSCIDDGKWSGSAPKCQSDFCDNEGCDYLSCGQPSDLENGEITFFNTSAVGGFVSYTCNDGYVLEGNPTKTCDNNTRWTSYGSHPKCIPIECPPFSSLHNGFYLYSAIDIHVGSTVIAECEPEYQIIGDQSHTCLVNGTWSGDETFCVKTECANNQFSPNYTVEIDGTFVGATLQYHCNPGYITNDVTVLTCLHDGLWSGNAPTCLAIECPVPETIANGSVINFGHYIGNTIHFNCNTGYKLVNGSNTRVCQENGSWSGENPICVRITCSLPNAPTNGHVTVVDAFPNQIVNYSCDDGYKLVGHNERICQENGQWNGVSPKCVIVQCETIPAFENGLLVISEVKDFQPFSYGTVVSFMCNLNFQLNLNSSDQIKCLSNGQWEKEIPKCVRSKCEIWPVVADGLVVGDISTSIGSVIEYKCRLGFQMIGQSQLQCLETGEWNGTIPKCVPVLCSQPPEVENSSMKLFIPEYQPRFSFGATVTYACKDGFELNGSAVLICSEDGKWIPEVPSCAKMPCPPPPIIDHATVQVENYEKLSRAIYFCNEGYMLNSTDENPVLQCSQTGQWDLENNRITCQPLECKTLPPVLNGHYDTNSTSFIYGSAVTVKCSKGYRFIGNKKLIVKCFSTGGWLGKIPRCRPVACPPPEVPVNSIINQSDANVFGAVAIYSCPPGFKLEGNSKRVCEEHGKWSGKVPQCLKTFCRELEPPINGFIMVTGNGKEYGNEATFMCADGYLLRGSNKTICGQNGRWSFSPPTCRGSWIVSCTAPATLSNATANIAKLEYDPGDNVTYHCNKGFVSLKSPAGSAVCQTNGSWLYSLISCQKISCGPPVVSDKNVQLLEPLSYDYGDTVSFKCDSGMYPKDSKSKLLCQEDGKWDITPMCEGLCPNPCLNGGVCIGPKKCRCKAGFIGDVCQRAFCSKPCKNGGTCIAYNVCKCLPNFTGKQCEKV
ncbi:hypothetical protein CHUAL_005296 [Chamberlinius hualienensis]